MSTTSPPPDSTPTAVPPTATSSPPPPVSPTIQPATPPDSSPPPPVQTPPPQSPPPAVPSAPPPSIVSSPPPTVNSPPPATPTPPSPSVVSSPPPKSSTPPPPAADPPKSFPSPPPPSEPPISSSPPPVSSPPPPVSTPPVGSPPPPTSTPPKSSPPPPTAKPPESSPPPPSVDPPANSPPPPTSTPPKSSPSPPKSQPPQSSPPPPSDDPPANSPPPPTSTPPKSSPSPPKSQPPQSSPPPPPQEPKAPVSSPPPPGANPPKNSPPSLTSPPPSNSTEITSPPQPPIEGQPPTSVLSPPSSPSPPSPSEASSPATGSGISTGTAVAISAALGLIVLSLIGLLVWCVVKRKRKRKASGYNAGYIMPSPYGSSPNSGSSLLQAHSSAPLVGSDSVPSPGLGNSRPWFTYEELFAATNGFSEQNILGEGGFGCVYKGCLPDGREVAVKQLKIGGGQGEREFKAEVEIISRIHHRHLVSLVGYCISDSRRLLIYEFVPNDTLYFHLHGKDGPVMDWAMRVRVAAGAARGIAYLHEDCHPRIIHRDIKSSNILLGANFEARVSDFGLAKLAADADTHITTRIMGTFGYMAPEYAASGKLTDKSDVYSFGVVLLEMITGRKPVDVSQPLGDESLVEWARPLLSDALETEQFDRIADPRLEKNYVESEMFRMVEAAAACVRHSAAKRPRMGQVVRALDSLAASDLSNGMKPGQSEVYDSEQQSAEIRLFQRMAFGSQNYSTDFFSQSSMLNK